MESVLSLSYHYIFSGQWRNKKEVEGHSWYTYWFHRSSIRLSADIWRDAGYSQPETQQLYRYMRQLRVYNRDPDVWLNITNEAHDWILLFEIRVLRYLKSRATIMEISENLNLRRQVELYNFFDICSKILSKIIDHFN